MLIQRAYSFLHVKNVDGEKRVITGTATTPTPDRMGDVVEPMGVNYKNPLPLLLYHDSKQPVGQVKFSKPTKDGIAFEASIPAISEPGRLKDRVDEAWQSVKAGLLAGVSIGFRSLEEAFMKDTGGIRFLQSEVLELSLVAVPANAEATISTIKSLDVGAPATGISADRRHPSAASGPVVTLTTHKDQTMTHRDKIVAFTGERASKLAKMNELAGANDGTTMDAATQESFDTLTAEIKSIDADLARLETLDSLNKAQAIQVNTENPTLAPRGPSTPVVGVKESIPADLEFARMVLCKAASYIEMQKGNFVTPLQVAKSRYPSAERIHNYLVAKTAVIGGTTTDSNYAAALLAQATVLESAFLDFLRPRTIVGKFGTNGIPALKRVPFNVKIQSQTSGASAGWVGEGKPKLVTKFNTTSTTLLFTKIAAIAVITEELARFSFPGAETLVRDELAKAVIERLDRDFIDPDKAVSSGVNPASITNGVTAKSGAGTSAANVLTDVQNLVAPFLLANYDVSDLVLIMPNSLALVLSLMQNSLGQDSFKGMTVNGGTLAGIPVITSQYAAFGSSYGNVVICVSAGNIALADDGTVTVDASREASIEMVDSSSQDATSGTGASQVSMFQTNSIALRAEREINWKKLRSDAVTFQDDVNWGSIGSPY